VEEDSALPEQLNLRGGITRRPIWHFDRDSAEQQLTKQFGTRDLGYKGNKRNIKAGNWRQDRLELARIRPQSIHPPGFPTESALFHCRDKGVRALTFPTLVPQPRHAS
jgi:hypothetical protein